MVPYSFRRTETEMDLRDLGTKHIDFILDDKMTEADELMKKFLRWIAPNVELEPDQYLIDNLYMNANIVALIEDDDGKTLQFDHCRFSEGMFKSVNTSNDLYYAFISLASSESR